jgi:methylated-DNA-protein-cysteine methyltransferase-like protein
LTRPRKSFFEAVYQTVCKVPKGRVTTYSAVAKSLGVRRGARAVGWAMRVCESKDVPCHRVVRSDAKISGDLSGASKRVSKLRIEGIRVRKYAVVDMRKHFFDDF